MIDFLKKNWKWIAFAAILLLAVFLRVFHFHDWLFFKMDQARDALIAKKALGRGIGWLPLLGPKAGGTAVDLGPAFYYFQYISAFLFQSARPEVLAYPDLLFAVLSIPLLFLFLKKYFSRDWSMIITGLYAVCFVGVEYSRFAWNPNSLVFFNLLFFYALLNIFDENVKYKMRWVAVAGFSAAVSTQLHFLSLATLQATAVIFLIANWKATKKRLNWKRILVFFAIVLVVYLPFVFNEILTHGKNTAAFFAAVKSKPSHHSLWQNILRDIRYWGQHWSLILFGWISKKGSVLPAVISWFGVMLPGLFLAVNFFRKEKNEDKKRFLLVSILWFAAYFLIYIPIAYQIRPRFFLPLLSLPFIFVGYISVYLRGKKSRILKLLAVAVLLAVFFGNLAGAYFWFKEQSSAQKKGVYPKRTIILKAQDGITLWHLEKAADFIRQDCGGSKMYVSTNQEYKSPMRYVANLKGFDYETVGAYDGRPDACLYLLGLTRSKRIKLTNKDKFDISSQEKIGALTVYKLKPKEGEVFNGTGRKGKETRRFFWKDVIK